MFWLVDNEIGLLWALYHKKQPLCIFVAKRLSTQLYSTKNMFWFVWRQTGLFPASEWPWFLFDCLQKNVLACLWLSYTVFSTIFLRTTFATFPYMKYVFDALTYQKYVLVRLQRVGAGLSFVSHQKSVFLRVCLNKLLSAILQEKHVLVCVP